MQSKKLLIRLGVVFLVILFAFGTTPPLEAQGPPDEDPQAEPAGESGGDPLHRVSDSPWLRLPEEMRDWPPITPPEPGPAGKMQSQDPTGSVVYDVATGQTHRLAGGLPTQEAMEEASTPPYQGLLPQGPSDPTASESVIGVDGRARVSNTTIYPWRTIVKLFMSWSNGQVGSCSGAVIDAFHVLTAGHCFYYHPFGGWANSVTVVPGLDDGYMPFYRAQATLLRTYPDWIDDANQQHDWGLITLDRNIGNFTGWMGRQTASPGSPIYTGDLTTAGYPADLGSACCQYFDNDKGYTADEYNHWYFMDTVRGQSGSPVWRLNSGQRYILTVHAYGRYGTPPNSVANHGTRLNRDKFNRIPIWIGADTPPTDRPDLIDDGQAFSGFTPATVTPGASSFSVYNDVRNAGTASSGGFMVSYFASTNSNITKSDYLIGTDTLSSIAPFRYADASWSGTFPSTIPSGTYWVGWIVDSQNQVTEFGEDNNTAYKGAYRLLVSPPIPANVRASDGTFADKVQIRWGSVPGATEYEIYRAESASGPKTFVGSTQGITYDDKTATPGTPHLYFVRSKGANGAKSLFSKPDTGSRMHALYLPLIIR